MIPGQHSCQTQFVWWRKVISVKWSLLALSTIIIILWVSHNTECAVCLGKGWDIDCWEWDWKGMGTVTEDTTEMPCKNKQMKEKTMNMLRSKANEKQIKKTMIQHWYGAWHVLHPPPPKKNWWKIDCYHPHKTCVLIRVLKITHCSDKCTCPTRGIDWPYYSRFEKLHWAGTGTAKTVSCDTSLKTCHLQDLNILISSA